MPSNTHGFQRWAAPRDDAHADCHSGPFSDDRRAVQQATRRRLLYCVFGSFPRHLHGHFILKLHPIGDFLAIAAALSWAFYSTLVKKIGNRYNGIYITRKIFFYAIVTMLPVLAFGDFRYDFSLSAKYLSQPDLPRRHCIFALLFDLEQNHLENRPGRGQ